MKKLLFIFCLLLAWGACTNKKKEIPKNLTTIKMGTLPSVEYIPFLVAEQLGIYDSLGLDVQFAKFYSERERNQAMEKDTTIDCTIMDIASAAIAHTKGQDISIAMQIDGIYYLIGSKEAKIKKIEDLKLRNIAVSHYTSIEYMVDTLMGIFKINHDSINKPEVNDMNIRALMLNEGNIEGAVFPEPYASQLIREDGNFLLKSNQDIPLHLTGLALKGKSVQKKENEIKVLMLGYNMAVDQLKSDTTKLFRDMLINESGTAATWADSVKCPAYNKAQLPSEEEMKGLFIWLHKKKLVPAKYTGEELINPTFVEFLK